MGETNSSTWWNKKFRSVKTNGLLSETGHYKRGDALSVRSSKDGIFIHYGVTEA